MTEFFSILFVILLAFFVVYMLSLLFAILIGVLFELNCKYPLPYEILGDDKTREDGILFISLCPVLNTIFVIYGAIMNIYWFLKLLLVDMLWVDIKTFVKKVIKFEFWKSIWKQMTLFFKDVFSNWGKRLKFFGAVLALPFKKD